MSTEQALRDTLISPNVPDSNLEPANVVDVIAGAGLNIARAIKRLGTNDAGTNMGAIEVLSNEIKEGSERIANALESVAQAIGSHARR